MRGSSLTHAQDFPSLRDRIFLIQLTQHNVMHRNPNRHKNELIIYRRRMGFSQKQIAGVLGLKSTSMLSRYESGRSLPPLLTALRLEVLYRIPVAFLYSEIYRSLKEEIRVLEDQLAGKGQLTLF